MQLKKHARQDIYEYMTQQQEPISENGEKKQAGLTQLYDGRTTVPTEVQPSHHSKLLEWLYNPWTSNSTGHTPQLLSPCQKFNI